MLNPYRGLMHSVATQWADAVTTDGRHWTLYVRGECLYADPDGVVAAAISVPDVKYGTWSADAGFARAPIRLPTFDGRVRDEGERLLDAVQRHAGELPFAPADRFELWLLHAATGRPLALIASACRRRDCEPPIQARWTPGQACMDELAEARELQAAVRALAGETPRVCWYERHADGSGSALSEGATYGDGIGSILPPARFDPMLVDTDALDEQQGHLLAALLHWQSPALLQLPSLSHAQRAHFEAAACRHALRLAEQLPLYPCVLDRQAITAALIEARLRRSLDRPPAAPDQAAAMSPDYIEIPD